MPIARLDAATPALIERLHEVYLAANDDPGPAMSLDHFTITLLFSSGCSVESYAEVRDGSVAGGYTLALPETDNTHLTLLHQLFVAPGARRHGVGSELLRHALARTRAHGRRLMIGESAATGPGAAFAKAHGFEAASTDARRVLDLRTIDWDRVTELHAQAVRHAEGYELEQWTGPAPQSLYPDLATLVTGMNDAPIDDLDIEDERWDAGRVADMEQKHERSGFTGCHLLARHSATGEPAGLTRIVYYAADHAGWARQGDTVVLREHRGHRLGLLLKVANLLALRDRRAGLDRVITWNAASNGPMVAINEQLGFQPFDEWHEWQLHLV
ncbi:GNAT family N-acetyltransferase [Streptosporangium sp. KLBMP 9127]|nr:GNAT family N-acetyltransferase [Streptosporangium sp. KLBMP 9127]